MTTYTFDEQKRIGEEYERELDVMFAKGFYIEPATPEEQRRGIDRRYISKDTGRCFTVEYKSDSKATETDNAFIEIISVDTANKPGWAYTSEAAYLFYYLPRNILYILTPRKLRNQLTRWIAEYPQAKAWNNGYCTVGVLVPLLEFERHSVAIVNL